MATGGEAVAKLADGRVVFVRGALAGERVLVRIEEEKKRFARGVATEILDPSHHRIDPSCMHARAGICGGCDWMHVAATSQISFKRELVIEQLQRLGRLDDPRVISAPNPRGRRTTVRCVVVDGKAGYRSRRSNDGFLAAECPAAHPLLEELILDGNFGDAREVTLRVGAATGERMAVVDGRVEGVQVPADVTVVRVDDPGPNAIHEEVAGRRWRISANSFFQTSHEGAEALVSAVARALVGATGSLVDLFAGVGLLGGSASPELLELAVEQDPSSVADARVNLQRHVEVVQSRVERWIPNKFDLVIADPARRGLGAAGVDVVDATQSSRLVLISCDPASLGRDAALLGERGYRLHSAELIDMFPDTSRIEAVSRFDR